MKLNNKGMTLVELVVSFAFLAIMITSMMGIVLNINQSVSQKSFEKDMYSFKNTTVKKINDTLLIKNKIQSAVCDNSNSLLNCTGNLTNSTSFNISYDPSTMLITLNGENLQIPHKSDLVYYGTNQFSFNVKDITDTKKALIIEINYYQIDDRDTNYGFKAVIPFD